MAAFVNTENNDGEGNINPKSNFEEWLKSMNANDKLIDKMLQSGLDMYVLMYMYTDYNIWLQINKNRIKWRDSLQELDANDKSTVDSLANEMGLSIAEKLKFQAILRKVPRQKRGLDVCKIYHDRHYHITYTNNIIIINRM